MVWNPHWNLGTSQQQQEKYVTCSVRVQLANTNNDFIKIFALNLSAPFIPLSFTTELQQVMPFCDIIIGNEAEAEAWASASGLPDPKDLFAITKAIALLPKTNAARPRIVVLTNGANPTMLVSSSEPENVKVFPVDALKDEDIVDTNGAGDAFAGGFLGALVAGKSWAQCVEIGHTLARMCVQQVRKDAIRSQ